MIATRLGKYEIRGELGRGAMGVVYLAWDPDLEREVAIKTMALALDAETEEDRARFHREARSAARLRHPNIVTIYELGNEGGAPFIAMELLEGTDLGSMIRSGTLPPIVRRLEILAAACDGLDYAHRSGVVHRDVKPENLFIQRDGRVKILDFGIAKLAQSEATRTGLVLGTVQYMSPEQIRGERAIDGRTDLFSAGVVLYELLLGAKPFAADTITSTLYRIVHAEPAALDRIERVLPPGLFAILRRALAKDPAERFETGGAMAAALRHAGVELARRADQHLEAAIAALAVEGGLDRKSRGLSAKDAGSAPTPRTAPVEAFRTDPNPFPRAGSHPVPRSISAAASRDDPVAPRRVEINRSEVQREAELGRARASSGPGDAAPAGSTPNAPAAAPRTAPAAAPRTAPAARGPRRGPSRSASIGTVSPAHAGRPSRSVRVVLACLLASLLLAAMGAAWRIIRSGATPSGAAGSGSERSEAPVGFPAVDRAGSVSTTSDDAGGSAPSSTEPGSHEADRGPSIAPVTGAGEAASSGVAPALLGTSSSAAPAAATADPGFLEISIAPWARIEAIENLDNGHRETPDETTPARLTLPPGRYRIRLSHPQIPAGFDLETELRPGRPTLLKSDLPGFDESAVVDLLLSGHERGVAGASRETERAGVLRRGSMARERSMIEEGLHSYFSGNFGIAADQFLEVLGRRPRIAGLRLMRGSALYSAWVLDGSADRSVEREARSEIAAAARLDPSLRPDPRLFPPKVIVLFTAARGA